MESLLARPGERQRYLASTKHFALIFIATLFLKGCDAISRTEVELSPRHSNGANVATDEVVGIVTKTADDFGLEEVERRDTDTSFSDSHSRIGQNPELWITIKHAPRPIGIEIVEMYIASPTDKHKRLAQSLVDDLNAGSYNASIAYQTPDAHWWPWLIGAAVLTSALVGWRLKRNRITEIHQDDSK